MHTHLKQILSKLTQKFTPIINPSYQRKDFVALDLSSSNQQLDINILQDPEAHHQQIQQFLTANKAKVAYGGYLEQRKLYDRSDYFQAENLEDKRNIHLGIDLWCEVGTEVLSPLDGVVHSFQENINFGDYGPTLILKHELRDHLFYTLYGHLSRESLQGKVMGQQVLAGEMIARLGSPKVNGEYAPHLHFQIIKDVQGKRGDYPGVASRSQLEFYKENCPDPNLLLKIY